MKSKSRIVYNKVFQSLAILLSPIILAAVFSVVEYLSVDRPILIKNPSAFDIGFPSSIAGFTFSFDMLGIMALLSLVVYFILVLKKDALRRRKVFNTIFFTELIISAIFSFIFYFFFSFYTGITN